MSLTRYLTEYLTNSCVNEKLDTKLFFLQTMRKFVKFSHLNEQLVSTSFFLSTQEILLVEIRLLKTISRELQLQINTNKKMQFINESSHMTN